MSAIVVGNGNVALDVARILTLDPKRLAETDIHSQALAALRDSQVREVVVLGRRGPADAAFTLPELIGLAALPDTAEVDVVLDAGGLPLPTRTPASAILADLAQRHSDQRHSDQRHSGQRQSDQRQSSPGRRRIVLRFGATPIEAYHAARESGRVAGLRIESRDGIEEIPAGLVVRAIGFVGRPVPGLPFDENTGTVRHDRGRVSAGRYVVGWAKRGARGHLGSNKTCAAETVERILDDLDSGAIGGEPRGDRHTVEGLLQRQAPHALGLREWRAIDAEERRRGAELGRPRVRLTDPSEIRRIALSQRVLA